MDATAAISKRKRGNQDDLMRLFQFDRSELAANAAGTLTERQVAFLKTLRAQETRTHWLWIGLLGIVAVGLSLFNSANPRNGFNSYIDLAVPGLVVVMAVIAIVWWLGFRGFSRDLAQKNAQQDIHYLGLGRHRRLGGWIHWLKVGGTILPVSEHLFTLLHNWEGLYCTLYYAPHSKTILAIELHEES